MGEAPPAFVAVEFALDRRKTSCHDFSKMAFRFHFGGSTGRHNRAASVLGVRATCVMEAQEIAGPGEHVASDRDHNTVATGRPMRGDHRSASAPCLPGPAAMARTR